MFLRDRRHRLLRPSAGLLVSLIAGTQLCAQGAAQPNDPLAALRIGLGPQGNYWEDDVIRIKVRRVRAKVYGRK